MKLRKNPLTPVGVRGSVFDYELQESVRAALLVDVPADIVGAVPAGNHRLYGWYSAFRAVIRLGEHRRSTAKCRS